jgi:hypothetical protein
MSGCVGLAGRRKSGRRNGWRSQPKDEGRRMKDEGFNASRLSGVILYILLILSIKNMADGGWRKEGPAWRNSRIAVIPFDFRLPTFDLL